MPALKKKANIKKIYHQLSKIYHTDRSTLDDAEEKFKKLGDALGILQSKEGIETFEDAINFKNKTHSDKDHEDFTKALDIFKTLYAGKEQFQEDTAKEKVVLEPFKEERKRSIHDVYNDLLQVYALDKNKQKNAGEQLETLTAAYEKLKENKIEKLIGIKGGNTKLQALDKTFAGFYKHQGKVAAENKGIQKAAAQQRAAEARAKAAEEAQLISDAKVIIIQIAKYEYPKERNYRRGYTQVLTDIFEKKPSTEELKKLKTRLRGFEEKARLKKVKSAIKNLEQYKSEKINAFIKTKRDEFNKKPSDEILADLESKVREQELLTQFNSAIKRLKEYRNPENKTNIDAFIKTKTAEFNKNPSADKLGQLQEKILMETFNSTIKQFEQYRHGGESDKAMTHFIDTKTAAFERAPLEEKQGRLDNLKKILKPLKEAEFHQQSLLQQSERIRESTRFNSTRKSNEKGDAMDNAVKSMPVRVRAAVFSSLETGQPLPTERRGETHEGQAHLDALKKAMASKRGFRAASTMAKFKEGIQQLKNERDEQEKISNQDDNRSASPTNRKGG